MVTVLLGIAVSVANNTTGNSVIMGSPKKESGTRVDENSNQDSTVAVSRSAQTYVCLHSY